jgi:hypothetical protein
MAMLSQCTAVHLPQIIQYGARSNVQTADSHGVVSQTSFIINLTSEEQAAILYRAKHLQIAPKECEQLTQQFLQDVNSYIGDKTKRV